MRNGTNGHNLNGGIKGGGTDRAGPSTGVRSSLRYIERLIAIGEASVDVLEDSIEFVRKVKDDPDSSMRDRQRAYDLGAKIHATIGRLAESQERKHAPDQVDQTITVEYVNRWDS